MSLITDRDVWVKWIMQKNSSKQELTPRQKEVLALVRKGLTNQEICRALNISANTVKVHLAKIFKIMDVSNRTEAASLDFEEKAPETSEVKILMVKKDLSFNPEMDRLAFTIVENLHRFRIFNICHAEEDSADKNFTYRFVFGGTQGIKSTFYLSIFHQNSDEILWTHSRQIDKSQDIDFMASQMTLQIRQQLMYSAAKMFEEGAGLQPRWWYASAFANLKMDCRCRESFDACEKELSALLESGAGNVYTAFVLTKLYYTAITESWIDSRVYFPKIQHLACSAMRENPYLCHSQFMMALFNILAGNKKEAIIYLLQISDANPQNVLARRILSQIYLLTGDGSKALELINDNERCNPELIHDPNQMVSKAFIYFLLDDFEKCEQIALQTLYIRPESPIPRLFLMICNFAKGNREAVQLHKQKLFEYHPNFKSSEMKALLKGVEPEKRRSLESMLEEVLV